MNCNECQLEIFDSELSADALAHISTCEDCRALDREVRLNASALSALGEEVLPIRPSRARRWPWAVAIAAAAILAIGLSIPRNKPVAPQPTTNRAATTGSGPAPVVMTPAPPAPKPVPVRRTRPAQPKPQPEQQPQVAQAEPLLVQFQTADPNVVIYWIIDPIQGE